MALQPNRVLRFIMVISVVVLTIFIYASYYSNPTMTIPTRIHSTAALISTVNSNTHSSNSIISNSISSSSSTSNLNNKSEDKGGGGGGDGGVSGNIVNDVNKIDGSSNIFEVSQFDLINNNNINHHGDGDSFVSRQQLNEVHGNNFDVVNTNSVNASKFLYEGSISNIQSFIKNADKILKNLTVTPTVNSNLTASQQKQQQTKLKQPSQVNSHNEDNLMPQSPSSTAIRISSSQQQIKSSSILNSTLINSTSQQLDLSNGIPTGQLYESGHLDVNPNLCQNEGDQIRLLIVITSAPTHRDARLSIRQTWGHYGVRRDISIAFILGRTLNPTIEESLNNENYLYGDLIRGRFIDSYNNLTLKTISILEWVDKQCPLVNYILKTDDDMFINVPKLLSFIDKQNQKQDKHIIYGRLAKKWKPIRNKKSKYYVAPGQFSQTVFPQFTTGPAYLMSSDIIHDLFIKSLEQTYLKLEDVFTTGIVAQLLNIKRVHVNEFLNRRIAFNPCNIRKAISVHMIKSNEQFDLWKKLLDTSTKCK